jgi:hypothetical protein
MRWARQAALLAGGVTLLAAPGLAALYVAANDGFGAGDLPAFALWSAFLSALVAVVAPTALRRLACRRRATAAALAAGIGLLLGVVFTFVVAFALGPVVHGFSFPILYLWAAAGAVGLVVAALLRPAPATAAAEGARHGWRRVLAVGALVLVVAVASLFVMLVGAIVLDRAEPEIHLIPAGYEGPVVIIYGDSAGAPMRREGRARVYEIPADGVLRTRFPANPGWERPDYFYVDAEGRRTAITRGVPCNDSLVGDPVQACLMPNTYVMGRAAPEYESYVVSRRATRRAMEARWDSTVNWAVFGDSTYRRPDSVPPR